MQNIEAFRKITGKSQKQIAEEVGVTQQAFCKWENGEALPQADKLPLLAKALGCTIDDLFTESADQKGA